MELNKDTLPIFIKKLEEDDVIIIIKEKYWLRGLIDSYEDFLIND